MIEALGGVFIYSENPKSLAKWYEKTLGFAYDYTEESEVYCQTFHHREKEENHKRYTVFSILYNKSRPYIPGKTFTLNLRVKNIEDTIENLVKNNVVVRGPEYHDEGKFAWINDPEGNYIELWEDVNP